MRILNAGCWLNTEGTDFIDLTMPPKRNDVKICNMNKDSIPYSDNTFDKIICKQVIEYIYNPMNMLNEFHRILKSGGILELTSPNESFHVLFSRRYTKAFLNKWNMDDNQFAILYNEYNLTGLLNMAGFKAIEWKFGFDGYTTPKLIIYKNIFKGFGILSKRHFSPQIILKATKR